MHATAASKLILRTRKSYKYFVETRPISTRSPMIMNI